MPAQAAPIADVRHRVMEGMAAAVREKGYAHTTISDVVRHARVSKRTFYEAFPDKKACMLATYKESAAPVMRRVTEALVDEGPWADDLRRGVAAYLDWFATEPALTQMYMVEILGTGPDGLALRRSIHREWGELIVGVVERWRTRSPDLRPLSAAAATAAVGGVEELVRSHVEDGRTADLIELVDPVTDFLTRLIA